MNLSIKNAIYQAIVLNKWLDIFYLNRNGEKTHFCIAINDIFVSQNKLLCDIYNIYKDNKTIKNNEQVFLNVDGILSAKLVENSCYNTPVELLKKVNENNEIIDYLEVVNFDNNILRYLADCYKFDNDPFLKETVMIDGLDTNVLSNSFLIWKILYDGDTIPTSNVSL